MWLQVEQPSGFASTFLERRVFLFQDSVIAQSSIQAYLGTNYHVHGATPLTLSIGVANAGLAALHKTHSVESSAYVTACNPFSQATNNSVNDERLAR